MRLPVRGVTAAMCVALITSCSAPRRKFDPEAFGSTTTHARNYAVVVTTSAFYDRFFVLLQRYLAADSDRVDPKLEEAVKNLPSLLPVPQPQPAAPPP